METDVLIIGQGICGTFLGWWLEQAGLSFIMIDEPRPFTASKSAAGLINPVTGRRIVTTWMIDELLPFAQTAYRQIGDDLGLSAMDPVEVVDFFPTAQMRLAFLKRVEEDASYLQLPADQHSWDGFFRYELGYGVISPCYLVNLPALLAASRKRMLQRGYLREERFNREELVVGPEAVLSGQVTTDDGAVGQAPGEGAARRQEVRGIRYRDIDAGRVVFCDGVESFDNPYFSRLPFAPNKGEALIVEIPELVGGGSRGLANSGGIASGSLAVGAGMRHVFKKGLSLAPWKEGLFWVGASYEWAFDHQEPTKVFRERTEAVLKDWLRVPFRTVEHVASVRPATLERRPFVGFHPLFPAVGILNGMGTKGCSLAPYFAHQLVESLTKGSPIRPDADLKRFIGILSRK
ncbi:MAG TPA: FAD-dependent oxidoreductase [Puia sp.]|nr:FAD-dependent oxidoreductase [Puia sp.]